MREFLEMIPVAVSVSSVLHMWMCVYVKRCEERVDNCKQLMLMPRICRVSGDS